VNFRCPSRRVVRSCRLEAFASASVVSIPVFTQKVAERAPSRSVRRETETTPRFGTSKVSVLESRPRSRIILLQTRFDSGVPFQHKLRVRPSTVPHAEPIGAGRVLGFARRFPGPPATPRDARVRVSRRRQEESRHTARPRERPPRLELPARCSIRRRRRPPRIIVPRTRPNRLESRTRT
jgi:hypothetical protein